MMGGDLILIRSHRFGPAEAALATRLEPVFGAGNVVLCLDESRGSHDTGRWPKTSLTADRLTAMTGAALPADWGWRMGDLCHLAVAEDFGPRPRQWLIESDVHIPEGTEAAIFARLAAIPAGFMACGLGPKKVKPIAEAVTLALPGADWGCIFAFNRLDGAHIPELLALRRQIAAGLASDRPGSRRKVPNDEAVLANLAHHRGWPVADLYTAAPEIFSRFWFDTNPPHLREVLDAAARPAGDRLRIAHPVLGWDHLLARLASPGSDGHPQAYKAGRLGRILASLDAPRRQQLQDLIARQTPPHDG